MTHPKKVHRSSDAFMHPFVARQSKRQGVNLSRALKQARSLFITSLVIMGFLAFLAVYELFSGQWHSSSIGALLAAIIVVMTTWPRRKKAKEAVSQHREPSA